MFSQFRREGAASSIATDEINSNNTSDLGFGNGPTTSSTTGYGNVRTSLDMMVGSAGGAGDDHRPYTNPRQLQQHQKHFSNSSAADNGGGDADALTAPPPPPHQSSTTPSNSRRQQQQQHRDPLSRINALRGAIGRSSSSRGGAGAGVGGGGGGAAAAANPHRQAMSDEVMERIRVAAGNDFDSTSGASNLIPEGGVMGGAPMPRSLGAAAYGRSRSGGGVGHAPEDILRAERGRSSSHGRVERTLSGGGGMGRRGSGGGGNESSRSPFNSVHQHQHEQRGRSAPRVAPSPSLSRNIVNFEDLPAGVASRVEVGVVNDFQVPATPPPDSRRRGSSGAGGEGLNGGGAEGGGGDDGDGGDYVPSAPNPNRPKPKMLRRGDGTRKLTEMLQREKEKAAAQLPSSSSGAIPSFGGEAISSAGVRAASTPRVAAASGAGTTPGAAGRSSAIASRATPKGAARPSAASATDTDESDGGGALSHHATARRVASPAAASRGGGGGVPPATRRPAGGGVPSSFVPFPAELLSGIQLPNKAARPAGAKKGAAATNSAIPTNPSADAIKAHLMSVFGGGLDTTVGGSMQDPEAAAIIAVDLGNFPQHLWLATSNGQHHRSADIASFVGERDGAVTDYLDVRRLDFLSSMFTPMPSSGGSGGGGGGYPYDTIARFNKGHEGFVGRDSVLKVHQYHTLVKQFEAMEE